MSNKTLKKPSDETASAHSRKHPLGLWLGVALLLFGLLAVYSGVSSLLDNKTRLIAPRGVLTVEVVDTPELRRQGLSDRQSLGNNEGMLFDFEQSSSQHCIWMKDMQFPLDIIWADENKQVVYIEQNVKLDTYPDSFCPDSVARYVLEINAGRSSEIGIEVGTTLRF